MLRPALLASLCVLSLLPATALARGDEAHVTHADTPAELADSSIVRALRTARDATTGLPTTWCGTRLTADDLVHSPAPAASDVKVVYAYASDQTDRSATWSDALQGNASTIQRFLAGQSGGGKAVRFDMGTSCGPQYLDVTVVPLPGVRTAYVGDTNFNTLRDDVLSALGPSLAARDVLIMADQLSNGGTYGLGELISGEDRPDAGNAHNLGDFSAAIYSAPGSAPDASGWQPTMMLHEITHNLGAVQPTALHATPNGHCWDGRDVMCYADGSLGSQPYTTGMCPSVAGAINQVYDCGHDDYYDPAPAPGSYLATHWNVYRSAFMAPCTDLGDACADLGRVLTPPVNTRVPQITGTPQTGQVITADDGVWLNQPTSIVVKWQHELAGGVWQDMLPAAHVWWIGLGDFGTRLRAMAVATNADGAATAVSEPTVAITQPAGAAAPAVVAPSSSAPRLTTAPAAGPAALAPSSLRVALRTGSKLSGRLTVTLRPVAAGVEVRSTATKVKARAGRWRLKLCATTAGQLRRCTLGPRASTARGAVKLAAARVLLRSTTSPVTVTAALVDRSSRSVARGSATTR